MPDCDCHRTLTELRTESYTCISTSNRFAKKTCDWTISLANIIEFQPDWWRAACAASPSAASAPAAGWVPLWASAAAATSTGTAGHRTTWTRYVGEGCLKGHKACNIVLKLANSWTPTSPRRASPWLRDRIWHERANVIQMGGHLLVHIRVSASACHLKLTVYKLDHQTTRNQRCKSNTS